MDRRTDFVLGSRRLKLVLYCVFLLASMVMCLVACLLAWSGRIADGDSGVSFLGRRGEEV